LRPVRRPDWQPAGPARRGRVVRFLEHGERADSLAQGHGGEQRLGAPPAGRGQRGGGDDGAADERAREAGAPQLLDEGERVTEGAAAAAQPGRDQQARPAEHRDLLPEIGREAARVERNCLHTFDRAALLEERARRLLQELL
jgi:hypothetical protein